MANRTSIPRCNKSLRHSFSPTHRKNSLPHRSSSTMPFPSSFPRPPNPQTRRRSSMFRNSKQAKPKPPNSHHPTIRNLRAVSLRDLTIPATRPSRLMAVPEAVANPAGSFRIGLLLLRHSRDHSRCNVLFRNSLEEEHRDQQKMTVHLSHKRNDVFLIVRPTATRRLWEKERAGSCIIVQMQRINADRLIRMEADGAAAKGEIDCRKVRAALRCIRIFGRYVVFSSPLRVC
jgi:hypothetical protein